MTSKEPKFVKKLNELVKEFNSLKIGGLKARGDDFGLHDFFLELNTRGLSYDNCAGVFDFVKKYRGSVGISPVRGNDCICIRIDDAQFNLK
jgi:hypothetical protein